MRRFGVLGLALAATLWLSACSTAKPVKNDREGFFARLGKNGRGPSARHSEKEIDPSVIQKSVKLRWPLSKVVITSPYGKRGDGVHEGIDLRAKTGTPVYAAHSGRVIYSGRKIRGYGKLIVIRHSSGLATIYAHNSKLLVKNGQKVIQGQKIALSGATGNVSGPHLHFEVRSGVSPVDPMDVLPKSVTVASHENF